MRLRLLPLALLAVLVASLARLDAQNAPSITPSRNDAARFAQKLVVINQQPPRAGRRRTPVTEPEVNAYLAYDAGSQIPPGIVEPHISILGAGRLWGRALVDLDVVRRQHETRGLLDPLRYLTGRLEITASGLLRTRDGVGRFEFESAAVSGVAVPKVLLQEVLSAYSRTPDHPNGIGLDDPFELPASIREIEVGQGQAVVVQ